MKQISGSSNVAISTILPVHLGKFMRRNVFRQSFIVVKGNYVIRRV
jgi:hypothetical protein